MPLRSPPRDCAEELILLADSSKFRESSGSVLCELTDIDVVVTDAAISDEDKGMLGANSGHRCLNTG
jgi:DeoR family ulaG and ulaABCDEF operon transcriptional repressor